MKNTNANISTPHQKDQRLMASIIQHLPAQINTSTQASNIDVSTQNELLIDKLLNYKHAVGPGERTLKEIEYEVPIRALEAMYRDFTKTEKEFLLYLYYYFNKFNRKIKISIKHLMDHFNLSKSWVLEILARLRDKHYIVKTGGGVGGFVTRRTLTDLGALLVKVIKKGFKHVTNRFTGPSTGPSPYISTKVTLSQEGNLPLAPVLENSKKEDLPVDIKKCFDEMRKVLAKE